jgi:pimeloyl-ACP methyl ester carboxylesterase
MKHWRTETGVSFGSLKSLTRKLCVVALIILAPIVPLSNAQEKDSAHAVSKVVIGEEFELWSKELKESRKYSVSLPLSYPQSNASYPLILVLDGESYFVTAVGACRFMSMVRLMPEAVVVGINNKIRRLDMTPPDISLPDIPHGRADAFLAFLQHDLLPVLAANYRLLPLRVLVGHSHGALLGTYAITKVPELFRWQVLIDAPLQLGERTSESRLIGFLKGHTNYSGRMISVEHSFGWTDRSWIELEGVAPRTFSIARIKMADETHPTMFYPALYEGLKWLFNDIKPRQDTIVDLHALKAYYARLAAAYGQSVPIPQGVLLDAAEDQLMAGRPEAASPIVNEIKKQFGSSAETNVFDTWIEQLNKNPLEETYDQILRSPPPTAQQARQFLGTWKAVIQHHSPNNVEITFEDRNGVVTAHQREYNSSGFEVSPILGDIAYVRMKGTDAIEWGFMNGMRPRTMIISYVAKLDADGSLTGTSVPKAVSYSPDRTDNPGRPDPFRFVRK